MAFIKNISSSIPDSDLVAEYKSGGDMKVLADLYQRYMELIYGVCLKYMEDSEEAKDCVISIYEELIVKVKKYEIDHFKGWLYQLARNHCLMKLRSRKSLPKNVNHEFVHLPENEHLNEVFEKEEHFGRMEHCMEQLVPEQRQVIDLFYLKEQCYKTIAEVTGFDLNKVRSFIQNGRRNLKICMEKKALENIS